MDNLQKKYDRWMSGYSDREHTSYEEYTEIIKSNNLVKKSINDAVEFNSDRFYEKAINALNFGINLGERLLSEENLIDEVELAKAYMNRGVAYEYLEDGEKTIRDKRKSVEMLEKLRSKGILEDQEDNYVLAMAYMNRGATYDAMGNYGMAIADGEKSINILEQLKQEGRNVSSEYAMALANISNAKTKNKTSTKNKSASPYKEEDLTMEEEMNRAIKMAEDVGDKAALASIYTNRGMECFQLNEYAKAVSYFNDAIEMMEGILIEGGQLDENEQAKAYAGRGMARYGKNEIELSIPDLNKAIKIWERLKESGKFVDENILALAYTITANVTMDMDESKSYNEKSIDTFKSKNTGKQIEENNLAMTYFFMGVSCDQKGKFLEANTHYDEAIKIWEELDKKGINIDDTEFAKAYMNRGANYYSNRQNAEALADYHKCISIIEQLKRDGVEQDTFDMVMAYKNRGMAYEVVGNMKEAIDDNLTALGIIKDVFSKQPELQEEYYGTLIEIMELVVKNNDQELFNKVIADFLYSMRSVPKTAEAEELQNRIMEQIE